MNSKKWGAIFDWDGVVVDSSKAHRQSWKMLAEENSFKWSDIFFERSFGKRNAEIIPHIFGWTQEEEKIQQLSKHKEELYRKVVEDTGIDIIEGIREWLEKLSQKGIPCVIGSSTERKNLEVGLKKLDLGKYFEEMVSSENVSLGKPNPEVFLKAAKSIHLNPKRCVVFEDVQAGIDAGKAGGMKVVAFTTTHPKENLKGADWIVNSPKELDFDRLNSWFS